MAAKKAVQRRMSQEVLEQIPPQLGLLPLRGTLVYPGMIVPLLVGRESSVRLIDDVLMNHRFLMLAAQKEAEVEVPEPSEIYGMGTVAVILKMNRQDDDSMQIIVQGITRASILEYIQQHPYLQVQTEIHPATGENSEELAPLITEIQKAFRQLIEHSDQLPKELGHFVDGLDDPGKLADLVAMNLNVGLAHRQQVLELLDIHQRLEYVSHLLQHELEVVTRAAKIQREAREEMDKAQRERFLRQRLAVIQKELGAGNPRDETVKELREKIEEADLPAITRETAERELDRIAHMHPSSAEYMVARTYIDWLAEIPWQTSSEDRLDVGDARDILNEAHFGLEKVKDRILEFLAVRKLKADMRGPILCLVGPPGVGKTSLGRSVAQAMGRKFVRLSLGGVRDEAEIRGHRRTYVGALPGRIIQSLRQAGTNNPVFVLDEVDKLGSDFRGDPTSALLEVLDPEQNDTFVDHYLDVPFDLSKVLFIAIANVLDTIPAPLRDRMEIVSIPGYTEYEKRNIATRYLVPKQVEAHGLEQQGVEFTEDALNTIVRQYTREAGVRQLEREIASVVRKVARRVAEGASGDFRIAAADLSSYLGVIKYEDEVAEAHAVAGVALGLAWTPTGGDVIFVEAAKMQRNRTNIPLRLTGQLGSVMQESAHAALSYIRSHAPDLGIDEGFFSEHEVHLHVPAGSIPKDGPSAGVTMAATLASLATGKQVRDSLAMTGEISLHGRVLPVSGVKEKALAASRLGIHTVVLPSQNQKDLIELPPEVRETLQFEFVDDIKDVLRIALQSEQVA